MRSIDIRKLPGGDALYQRWIEMRRKPCDDAWDKFPAFYAWIQEQGYNAGDRVPQIKLLDASKPYCPANCTFAIPISKPPRADMIEAAKEWDLAMSAFRERLHRASRYNPEAIQRMLDNKPWAAKKAAPGTGTPESGKGNNHKSIIAAEGAGVNAGD